MNSNNLKKKLIKNLINFNQIYISFNYSFYFVTQQNVKQQQK